MQYHIWKFIKYRRALNCQIMNSIIDQIVNVRNIKGVHHQTAINCKDIGIIKLEFVVSNQFLYPEDRNVYLVTSHQ